MMEEDITRIENIEEAMKMLERIDVKFFLTGTVEQSDYIVDKADEVNNAIDNILSDYKRVLKENEELKQMLDERFIYVTGARTVYARLMQLDKEIIVKDDLKRRNEINQLLKENEELKHKYDKALSDVIAGVDLDNTYIPVQKIQDKIEELEPELKFEITEREARLQINLLKSLLKEG